MSDKCRVKIECRVSSTEGKAIRTLTLSLDTQCSTLVFIRHSLLITNYFLLFIYGGLDASLLGQADQISDRVDAKLLHNAASVYLDGFLGDVKL